MSLAALEQEVAVALNMHPETTAAERALVLQERAWVSYAPILTFVAPEVVEATYAGVLRCTLRGLRSRREPSRAVGACRCARARRSGHCPCANTRCVNGWIDGAEAAVACPACRPEVVAVAAESGSREAWLAALRDGAAKKPPAGSPY